MIKAGNMECNERKGKKIETEDKKSMLIPQDGLYEILLTGMIQQVA